MVSPVTIRQSEPHAGLSGRVELTVSAPDTASSLRSGDVPVLGTPRLIALCEEATMVAIAGALPEGWTTVAMRVQFDHLAPVAVGSTVAVEAVLDRVEGRRLVFTVTVNDASGLVGAGRVTRVSVERERFLGKAR
jgi:fluoroacetyl-CoA thioesterase